MFPFWNNSAIIINAASHTVYRFLGENFCMKWSIFIGYVKLILCGTHFYAKLQMVSFCNAISCIFLSRDSLCYCISSVL